MRIGFDIGKVADFDGIGSYCRELLRALPHELGDNDSLWLYSAEGAVDEQMLEGILGPEILATDRLSARLGEDPTKDGLDLYHATRWHLPPRFRGRGLFTCYDLTVLDQPECHTVENRLHTLEGLLRARLEGWHFLSISHSTAAALEDWLEVPVAEQAVIYPAVAPIFGEAWEDPANEQAPASGGGRAPQEARESVRRELERRFDLTTAPVLAVGTLEPRKNLLRLLDAYGRLPEALRRRHPLVLAGSMGWQDAAELEALLERPELSGVLRLGRVAMEDLPWLYRGAVLFAYPSLAEGFGLPILEAMTCGAPVLTSEGGATEETAGGAAHCIPAQDVEAIASALEHLLADPDAREELRLRGHKRARDFSWQQTARQVIHLYRSLGS